MSIVITSAISSAGAAAGDSLARRSRKKEQEQCVMSCKGHATEFECIDACYENKSMSETEITITVCIIVIVIFGTLATLWMATRS